MLSLPSLELEPINFPFIDLHFSRIPRTRSAISLFLHVLLTQPTTHPHRQISICIYHSSGGNNTLDASYIGNKPRHIHSNKTISFKPPIQCALMPSLLTFHMAKLTTGTRLPLSLLPVAFLCKISPIQANPSKDTIVRACLSLQLKSFLSHPIKEVDRGEYYHSDTSSFLIYLISENWV